MPCLLTGGAESPRDLPVPGRDLEGVHFAMEFLPQQNKVVAGDKLKDQLRAEGKHVVVIGGGDTGSDCVGTSNRHGAASVTQFELMPQPPEVENRPMTWPYWPVKLRTSSSHEEGCERQFAIATKSFNAGTGKDKGRLKSLTTVKLEWKGGKFTEVPGSEQEWKADLRPAGHGLRRPHCLGAGRLRRRQGRPWQRQRPAPSSRAATPPMWPRCLPPATCAAASPWWFGPSAKGAKRRGRWTSS